MDVSQPGAKRASWLTYLLKFGVPLVITVGLCYMLFTGIDFNQMVAIIRDQCDFRWIAAALCVSVLSHVVRAMRWQLQLHALGVRPPLWNTILSIFGTYAVNLVFPRLGELWRTGYIAKRQDAQFTTVFGSMVADRLADTLTVLLLTLVTFFLAGPQLMSYLSQNAEGYERIVATLTSPWLWTCLVGCVVVAVAVVWRFRKTRAVSRLAEAAKGLWQGFAVVVSMPGRGWWLLLTVAIWSCYFFQLYLAFFAFPLTAEVVARYGAVAVLVCFVLSSISMGVPSNGGIGPWQWAIIFGLSLYAVPGLDKGYSTSFANLVMGTQTLLLIVLGILTFICVSVDKRRTPASKR
ncbi:MAG: flippase-like domain-containing protein [Bacteroides sp.]|nr:flippase-like domain-containing protein [Bacteroides sp.]